MSPDQVVTKQESGPLGAWSLACGVIALVGVLMIGQASWEWIPSFDPPGWLRIITGWMLPIGSIAAFVLGVLSVVKRSGRSLGLAGIALGVLSVGIFVGYLVTHPY